MDLTAKEIHEKQFHDAWRGYNQEEVDDFLDRVAESLERLQRDNRALQQRVQELDQMVAASRSTEEMLKKTLVTAQKAAEEAIANARARAEQLIGEAEERARRAADEAAQRTAEAERTHAERKRQLDDSVERLQAFQNDLKQKLVTFLEAQLRSLDSLDTRPAASARPAAQRPVAHVSEHAQQRQDTVELPADAEATPARALSWRPNRSQ